MESVQPRELLFYYAAVIFIGLVLFVRRRPRRGMRLNLRARPRPSGQDLVRSEPRASERPLNVVFNYNGHSWDAFEVLGLPAGASFDRVEEAYRQVLAKSDPTSHNFLTAAYRAIIRQNAS